MYYRIKGKACHFENLLSTGIYLLDAQMNNTEYPYPYHTDGDKLGSIENCIGGLRMTASLIENFNKRLYRVH